MGKEDIISRNGMRELISRAGLIELEEISKKRKKGKLNVKKQEMVSLYVRGGWGDLRRGGTLHKQPRMEKGYVYIWEWRKLHP